MPDRSDRRYNPAMEGEVAMRIRGLEIEGDALRGKIVHPHLVRVHSAVR